MSTIRLGAAVNVREFQSLLNSLETHQGHVVDSEALQDEFGRFRVWSGNLGVLQKRHSSLDYRLRDAPLLSNEVSKLLKELEENLHAAHEIVSGVRLPYEQQPRPTSSEDEDADDSFFSEDEDEGIDSGAPRTELSMRFHEVVDIIDHLYKISVRIRAPTVRTRSLKAASYQPKDPETGIDLLSQYAIYDNIHTQELVRHLRMPYASAGEPTGENDDLVNRLARGVTLRRRQFKYWRRHRDKLGISTVQDEPQAPAAVQRPEAPYRHDTLEAQPGTPGNNALPKQATSQKTGKTLLSGTEATHHHQSLDDIVDSKSVTSYAVTVKDLSGKGIDLPPPPKAADGDKDFECPYCFIICPARYGKGRPWRTHVLRDLQPYVCTYLECQASDQLFGSRRDWAEHESSHRKVWRCPEHPDAVYKSESGLEEHIRKRHEDSVLEDQIPSIVKVGETSTIDLRQNCPVCCASVDQEGMGTLQNHIANHLERIAAFSLPIDMDDDCNGGSSRASRGGTGSSEIPTPSRSSKDSDDSDHSDEQEAGMDSHFDIDAMVLSTATDKPSQSITAGPGFLSESLIRALPDDSEHRFNLLFSDHKDESDSSDYDTYEEESVSEDEEAFEKHMAEREAFRMYLLSLPGAQSVRFYKRYGSWNGNINFPDGDLATRAMQSFDKKRYPKIQLVQRDAKKETLRFSVQHEQTKQVSFRTETAVVESSPPASPGRLSSPALSVSSGYEPSPFHEDARAPSPILFVTDIPNLRSLYRSGKLVPGSDSSYVPDNRCNEIIAFCYHDITRLKVDAIVNSSNRRLTPSKADWTLNNIIHKAAGPGLYEECSRLKRLSNVSQSVLTGGHQLPCTHVIHVARPKHTSSKGMGQYNLLTEGYRSALKLAMKEDLKTIAFCCLGTGGLGFPARIAARVALQEAREFLDAHPRHSFERIVFCVYTEEDSTAYTDFFPLFFPPTQEDLDNTVSSEGTKDAAKLIAMIQEVNIQVDIVSQKFAKFGTEATHMPQHVTTELSSIAMMLKDFKEVVLENPSESLMYYIDILCSVMLAICENMTGMHKLAEGKDLHGRALRNKLWDEYNNHMQINQGVTIVDLIGICHEFAQHLNDVLVHNAAARHEIWTIGTRLGVWLTKNTREGPQSILNHLEEVMLTREFQRDAPVSYQRRGVGTVKLHQVPTLAQLYQQGTLQAKDTQAIPSARSNETVCLARDDVTKLEVDVIVSSTDTRFSGMGRLDRNIILGGGIHLQEECDKHSPCKEGEVVLTGGYDLPAKHVLHAITPATYRVDALEVLREMYRKILHMASYLHATSIAIPSLGTGMLNYPRRDAAAVAIEEVKRFLESKEESNPIEKIVLVVFSPNDEFVYRSLLPVYFPPNDLTTDQSEMIRSSPKPITSESRTLFGTLGEPFRKIAPGKQPVSNSRSLEPSEEDMLIAFESHAQGCPTCSNISEVYSEGRDLCDDGYRLAAQILRHINMRADQAVYPLRSVEDVPVEVEIPDLFPLSLELLHTVEKSFRDPDRDRPFVSNQPSLGARRRIPEYTMYSMKVTVSSPHHSEKTFDRIYIWSDPSSGWQGFKAPVPTLHLTRGALWIQPKEEDDVFRMPMRLNLSPGSAIRVQSGTEIVVDVVNADGNPTDKVYNQFTLSLQSQSDCEMLLTRIKHAARNSPTSTAQEESPPDVTTCDAKATIPPQGHSMDTFAHVSLWKQATESWEALDADQSETLLQVRPGSLEIPSHDSKVIRRLKLTSYSIIREQSDVEILIDRVTMAGDSDAGLGRWKRILLRCRSQPERNALLARLQHAAESSGRPNTPSQSSSETKHTIRENLGVRTQSWKDQDQGVSESSQTGQPTEQDLPLGTTEDLVNTPEQTRRNLGRAATVDFVDVESATEPLVWGATSHARRQSDTAYTEQTIGTNDLLKTPGDVMSSARSATSVTGASALQDDDKTKDLASSRNDQDQSETAPETGTESQDPSSSKPKPTASLARMREPVGNVDARQTPVQATSATSVSSAPRDPLSRLIDPKIIPLEEIEIEAYWKYVYPGDSIDDTTIYTQIDKRLVYEEVLGKAGLEFGEEGEWWFVLDRLGKEEVLRLHEETRKTHRFTPQEHRWE